MYQTDALIEFLNEGGKQVACNIAFCRILVYYCCIAWYVWYDEMSVSLQLYFLFGVIQVANVILTTHNKVKNVEKDLV